MNILKTELKDLSFSVSTFFLKFTNEIEFNNRLHFALRGSLGSFLRKASCMLRSKDCPECLLKSNCAYAYIFNTSPTDSDYILNNYKTIPHPYVINNLNKIKEKYIKFDLILVGKAVPFFPYFVLAYNRIGQEKGLYNNKFTISKISSYKTIKNYFQRRPFTVFTHDKILKEPKILKIAELELPLQKNLEKLSFITPVRIKYNGKYITDLKFHYLIRSLTRRISLLLYYHCGVKWNVDFKEIIEKSKKIKIEKKKLRYIEWERYSKRQNQKMRLGGIEGEILLKNNRELKYFAEIIITGSIINAGKQTAFGFGNYHLVNK